MSGGSLDYVCFKVDDAADTISRRADGPLHKAFAAHLVKVAKALHDIELNFSGDTGPGDDHAAILACISADDVRQSAIDAIRKAVADGQEAINLLEAAR